MKGFVLIYTLWIIGAVSVITLLVSSKIVLYTYYYNTLLDRLISLYESQAVAVIALERFFRRMEAQPWVLPDFGEPEIVSYGGREYNVYITPEDSKIPLRVLDLNGIRRMLQVLGVGDRDLDYYASKIARDINTEKYKNVGMIYWMLDEDYSLYLKIRDSVSFHTSRVNVNYATREVLLSVGFTEKDVEKIMRYRENKEFVDFFEFQNYLSTRWAEFERLITLAPRPHLYRVRVKQVKPRGGYEMEYIISSDFSTLDRLR